MNADYALIQLLKLDSLTFDEIKFYTNWTAEKSLETIKKCKDSGQIERKCSKSQYGYKWEVRTVPNPQRVTNLQRIQPKMHSVWGERNSSPATPRYRTYSENGEIEGLVNWICE